MIGTISSGMQCNWKELSQELKAVERQKEREREKERERGKERQRETNRIQHEALQHYNIQSNEISHKFSIAITWCNRKYFYFVNNIW